MTNWLAGRGNLENLAMNNRVKLPNILAALLLWSGLFSLTRSLAADLPVVRASYNAIGGVFTPLWVAHENKLFNKYGISVDLKFLPLTTGTQALLTKNVDIITPGGELLEAGLNGERVVYIAGIANRVVLSIFAKPEIQSLADLRDKVVSALSPGSISDHLARILFQEAGLVPGQDVKMLYLKTGPEILAALTSGVIDAGIISAPVTLKARQAGFKEIVNVPERNIPMIHAGLATTRDFVKEHRDRVRGFLQGYMEAVRYAATNPKETKQIIGTFTKTTNQEDLEETYQTFIKVWERVPYVSTAGVQSVLNFTRHAGAKAAKPEQFIDNSLLSELEKSGFVNQLYGR
jgi:ABC-type nitrate/sulfonate/bicarbonate transport system substrate-binding protein